MCKWLGSDKVIQNLKMWQFQKGKVISLAQDNIAWIFYLDVKFYSKKFIL